MTAFLEVSDLRVEFTTEDGIVRAVDGVSYSVEKGRTLAVVGESGSGKSVTSNAVMGLLNRKTATVTGEVRLDGEELVAASDERVRELRGKRMAMIFQDPLSSLHPFYRVGKQLVEAAKVHQKLDDGAARERAVEMLRRVGIPSPEQRIDVYPHQLSGGMRQRVMIAMALINDPELLIADEPTTALDVTVQAQIIDLLRDLQQEFGTAIILITHDLGVVADMADEVVVMYGGRVVEHGSVEDVYYRPEMPYTWGLLSSVPRLDQAGGRLDPIAGSPPSLLRLPKGCVFRPRCAYHNLVRDNRCDVERPDLLPTTPGHEVRCHIEPERRRVLALERVGPSIDAPDAEPEAEPDAPAEGAAEVAGEKGASVTAAPAPATSDVLLQVSDLRKHFPIKSSGIFRREIGAVKAVDGLSLEVRAGETVGLVGESGCGKSTAGRTMLKLLEPTTGSIAFQGQDISGLSRKDLVPLRREMQMIFQDPYSSLNPRHTVGSIVGAPYRIQGVKPPGGLTKTVQALMDRVGLNPEHYNRYPNEFSGGQRQRIGIARAIALNPKLIVCDEPVSALDVSIQAQVVNLLEDLQDEYGLAYVFIAHDLSVVRHISDRVAVMYLGKVMETAPTKEMFVDPRHPYSVALLSAVPIPDPRKERARERVLLEGDLPSPSNPPSGCVFRTRCFKAQERCATEVPELRELTPDHFVACHFPVQPELGAVLGLTDVGAAPSEDQVAVLHSELASEGALADAAGTSDTGTAGSPGTADRSDTA